jgi:SAM-dependent methyltransferase
MSADPPSLADWFASPLGLALLERERAVVATAFEQVFGSYLLQIGGWGPTDAFLPMARTQRRALVAEQDGAGDFVSHATELAVASNSVDALFLPHTLEFEPEPHTVLREAERVLIGEGHLVVLGFAPWGLWGLRHRFRQHGFPPGLNEMWSQSRLSDALRVLGFEVESVRRYLCLWPSQRLPSTAVGTALERAGDWLGRVAGGVRATPGAPNLLAGAYVLCARKRVYAPTRVIQVRRRAPRFTPALARPTASLASPPPHAGR